MQPYRDAQDLWGATLGVLQLEVTRPTYETWLRGTGASWDDGGTLVVGTPNPFVASWLEKRMYSLIKKTVEAVAQAPLEVRFQVGGTPGPQRSDPSSAAPPTPPDTDELYERPGNRGSGLNDKYTFGSFVMGKSNQLAHAAAYAVAELPGRRYNPLFIYSDVGLGKTHLLHAIGHELLKKSLSVLYVSTEQFTNEFIKAIREGKTEAFRSRYRDVNVLLMDDIQFINGKEQTQEGFFHTFNELHNANSQIVLTSDHPPRSLALLEDRLRSRFEWGLIVDMQPPDLETRIAILQQKAATQPQRIPPEVTDYVAHKVLKNIRELEGSLNRILAYADLTNQPVSLELASQALADLYYGPNKPAIEPQEIIQAVSLYYGLDPSALSGNRRDKKTAKARHLSMYLLREEANLSVTEIGRLLGGRDHSTVINACGKISYQMNVDSDLLRSIIAIKDTFREAVDHRLSPALARR